MLYLFVVIYIIRIFVVLKEINNVNEKLKKTCCKTHKIIAVFIACINKRLYLYSVDNEAVEFLL